MLWSGVAMAALGIANILGWPAALVFGGVCLAAITLWGLSASFPRSDRR